MKRSEEKSDLFEVKMSSTYEESQRNCKKKTPLRDGKLAYMEESKETGKKNKSIGSYLNNFLFQPVSIITAFARYVMKKQCYRICKLK